MLTEKTQALLITQREVLVLILFKSAVNMSINNDINDDNNSTTKKIALHRLRISANIRQWLQSICSNSSLISAIHSIAVFFRSS
jgi:hypothetical protein